MEDREIFVEDFFPIDSAASGYESDKSSIAEEQVTMIANADGWVDGAEREWEEWEGSLSSLPGDK